jgi:hypothetical protein
VTSSSFQSPPDSYEFETDSQHLSIRRRRSTTASRIAAAIRSRSHVSEIVADVVALR